MKRYTWLFLVFFFVAIFSSISLASEKSFRKWEDKKRNELVVKIVKNFPAELKKYSYTKGEVEKVIGGLRSDFVPSIKRGKPLTQEEKRKRYESAYLFNGAEVFGHNYINKHRHILSAMEKKYGIEKEGIVSVLWIETFLGENTGKTQALQGLYNYYVRYLYRGKMDKAEEFRRYICYFLALCKKHDLDLKIKGSSAGALGIPQFMPYSVLVFGVDGDGDGEVDLFNSHADAIYSVANYLKRFGWDKNKKGALKKYNNDETYVATILKYAQLLRGS